MICLLFLSVMFAMVNLLPLLSTWLSGMFPTYSGQLLPDLNSIQLISIQLLLTGRRERNQDPTKKLTKTRV